MTTSKIETRPDGEIISVTGCSGSGKTIWSMRRAASAKRLLVWDSHLQWHVQGCEPIRTIPTLARTCSTRESAHIAYIGPFAPPRDARGRQIGPDPFDGFCRVALAWARLAPCCIVVEELAEVTAPGKAPPAWGELIRWIRKLGGTLLVISQRPQESDKTSLNNSQRIICHACNGEDDARYMARALGVPLAAVLSLNFPKCEHIERLPNRTTRRAFTRKPV